MITIDDFAKIEIRVGLVVEATVVEGSEKLIREVVDFGPTSPQDTKDLRIIFSGVRKWYTPEELVGKKFLYVTNLEPRPIMGEESQGMILAVDSPEDKPLFVSAADLPVGAKVR
jgi:methionine--tRNA ligase beta chain